jgi:hypothetical protein
LFSLINTYNNKVFIFIIIILCIPESYAENNQGNNLNKLIRGEYAFTIYRSCIVTPTNEGFDPETLELQTDAEHVIFVDAGIFHFDGKGKITTKEVKIIQLSANQLFPGQTPVVPGLSSSCEGNYNVKQNRRSYSAEFSCIAQLGGGAKLTITPFKAEGYIGRSRKTITINEIEGNIQDFTISLGDIILQANERICTTSGTLVKIKSGR